MNTLLVILSFIPYFILGWIAATKSSRVKTISLVLITTLYTNIHWMYLPDMGGETLNKKIEFYMEYAYSEGQIDYSKGDMRIEIDSIGNYNWCKSPWDNGKSPRYKFELNK